MFPNTQRALNIAHTPQISSWNIECCLCCGGKKKVLLLNTTWSGKSMIHHHLPWDTRAHAAEINNGRRRIPTDLKGESHLCVRALVCLCARASSSAHVLLCLIIVCIHHNKQLHNSALQNKRTTLCMLKNKWPYKWWTRQTLRGYHSVGSPLICFHTWQCVKQVHRKWKTAQKKKGTKTFKRVALVLHKAVLPPKGLKVRHKATPQSQRLQHLNVVSCLLFTKYIHKEESYELARQQWTA